MTDYTESIRESHAIVWRYRDELQDVWPTPPRDDALRFAVTEVGEAMDAWLRLRGGYARNNDKTLSVEDELADCAMMLLTAVGPEWAEEWKVALNYPQRNLDVIVARVLESLYPGTSQLWLDRALGEIAAYIGERELPARITARLERIKAKRIATRSE